MRRRRVLTLAAALALTLAGAGCAAGAPPTQRPTPTREPTATPTPEAVSLEGPSCPEGFDDQQVVSRDAAVDAGATITLTLGSTPSMPCGWQKLEISDEAVVRRVDRRSKWPAEGVTPMPGAPGVEVWILEAREEGESTLSLDCSGLEEEALSGTFVLEVTVR